MNKIEKFIMSIESMDIDDEIKAGLIEKYMESIEPNIKKSIMINKRHIELIDEMEGRNFSEKIRNILDEYFAEVKK